ncbi:glycosyltransferase [Idiomarina piscisalsi]|uniref:Glycosyltransferase n=1 Tax=Idiomarina piscisalsi TaxID=1096243 RepID=A0A432YU13_9GAMM|nr:glycosyltransferase [Idiomarina piscisalsi]RUO66791.1 hypothetical protein CWI73_05805 [Idiomarina piscisalsi]
MKIAHIILTHSFAGSERHAIELANMQADTGHDVTVVLHKRGTENRDNAIIQHIADNISVKVIDGSRLFASRRARQVIREIEPDVAHAHLSAACKALKGLSGKCLRIATLHIHYKPQQHRHLDALIAIAPWQLEAIPSALKKNSAQIDNWSQAVPASKDAREQLRAQYGIANDEIVFGTLGRVVDSKGHETLIEAFHLADVPNSRLVIVGDGKNWKAIREKAESSIVMPGFSNKPHDWLACFDVFVSAAKSEPFGLVFLEAMHAQLPIVSSASHGAQYLKSYFPYPLSDIGNAEQLAEIMQQAAKNTSPVDYDMESFHPDAKCNEVIQFYQQQLQRIRQQ